MSFTPHGKHLMAGNWVNRDAKFSSEPAHGGAHEFSGLPVLSTTCPEPVLLGAAMLGAVASGRQPSLQACMATMSHIAARFEPATGEIGALHAHRFRAYEAFQEAERFLRTGPVHE